MAWKFCSASRFPPRSRWASYYLQRAVPSPKGPQKTLRKSCLGLAVAYLVIRWISFAWSVKTYISPGTTRFFYEMFAFALLPLVCEIMLALAAWIFFKGLAARLKMPWLSHFASLGISLYLGGTAYFVTMESLWLFDYSTHKLLVFPQPRSVVIFHVLRDYAIPPGFLRVAAFSAFWIGVAIMAISRSRRPGWPKIHDRPPSAKESASP